MSKILTGKIIKKSAAKTVKVMVVRTVTHPIYKKQYKVSKNYLVDDPSQKRQVGETVQIVQTAPISKLKHFKILETNKK